MTAQRAAGASADGNMAGDDAGSVLPLGVAAAAVAVAAWGLSGVIAKGIDMGGIAIATYRFLIYGIVLSTYMVVRRTPMSWRALRLSFWGGMALGADVAFFFSAVKLTTVANATVIGALQPILMAIVAVRFFGERVARRDAVLALVAIGAVAVVVLAGADNSARTGQGDLLAVGALFSWSAYFVFAKRAAGQLTSQEYTIGVAIWTGLCNLPLALIFGQSLQWPGTSSFLAVLVLAFGAGLLGHSMMNWSIQKIPLWISSTMTLLIPVVSAAAAWLFLDEQLTAAQIGAMAVVIAALAGIVAAQ